MIIHAGCGAEWSAPSAMHCGSCHRTFSGLALFDRHRHARGEHGGCAHPASVVTADGERVMFLRNGMWRGPEMTEADKAARWGIS